MEVTTTTINIVRESKEVDKTLSIKDDKSLYTALSLKNDNYNPNSTKLLQDPEINKNKISFAQDTAQRKEFNQHELDVQLGRTEEPLPPEIIKSACSADATEDCSLSLAGAVLSAVNAPEALPLKVAVSFMTTDNKKEQLSKSLIEGDKEDITKDTYNFLRNGISTTNNVVKLAEIGVNVSADVGILSSNVAQTIGKTTSTIAKTASKCSIPFAVSGLYFSAKDVHKSFGELKAMDAKRDAAYQERLGKKVDRTYKEMKLTQAVQDQKASTIMKTTAFALSAVSVGTLYMSVRNPASASIATPVSLVTGIASSVVGVMSDKAFRHNIVTIAERKIGFS